MTQSINVIAIPNELNPGDSLLICSSQGVELPVTITYHLNATELKELGIHKPLRLVAFEFDLDKINVLDAKHYNEIDEILDWLSHCNPKNPILVIDAELLTARSAGHLADRWGQYTQPIYAFGSKDDIEEPLQQWVIE